MMKKGIVKVGVVALAMGAPLGVAQAYTETVYFTVDSGNDIVAQDSLCSLREAIDNANDNAVTHADCLYAGVDGPNGVDVIQFDSNAGSIIKLESTLEITDDLMIDGSVLITTAAYAGDVFRFNPPGSQQMRLDGVVISNPGGRAVYMVRGSLALNGVALSGNDSIGSGGALYFNGGTSGTITDSQIKYNKAGIEGGAIYAFDAALVMNNVEFDRNSASTSHGGAISMFKGSLTVNNGALVNNGISSANNVWGGAVYAASSTVELNNVTVANNQGGSVAGLYLDNVSGGLANVTLAHNNAPVTPVDGLASRAGGLFVVADPSAGFKIRNSIVAGNYNAAGISNCNLSDVIDDGYNLEGVSSSCFVDATSLTAVEQNDVDLDIEAMYNGGNVQTVRLGSGSLAIDGGNPAGCINIDGVVLTQDGRATAVRSADGNGDGEKRCDMGAYEFAALGAIKLTLDKSTIQEDVYSNLGVKLERVGELVATSATVKTSDGTAVATEDYSGYSSLKEWPAGDASPRYISSGITDDTMVEKNEVFYVALSSTEPGLDLINTPLPVTIQDDDLVLGINAADSSVSMAESVVSSNAVRVEMNTVLEEDVTVSFSLGGTAVKGEDYTVTWPAGNTLTIPAGVAYADILIKPVGDKLDESDETVVVTLGTPSMGIIGTSASLSVSIIDDDTTPVFSAPAPSGVLVAEDIPTVIGYTVDDADGDTVTVTLVGEPTHGVALLNTTDGNLLYTSTKDYNGSDTLELRANDGVNTVDFTVAISVTPVNDAPIVVNDSATTNEDEAVVINLLANDSDPDVGDTLTVITVDMGLPSGSTVEFVGGMVTYTPAANFHGSDSFSYTVRDSGGVQVDGDVFITVTPVNDAPSLSLSASALEVVAGASVSIDVTISDVDGLDGATITARSVEGLGVVTVSGNRVTYAATTAGSDTVQITVTDAGGLSATSTASVTVAAAPVAASSGGGGGGGSISWLLLLAGLPQVRRRRAA